LEEVRKFGATTVIISDKYVTDNDRKIKEALKRISEIRSRYERKRVST
jgi:hypothetical protein